MTDSSLNYNVIIIKKKERKKEFVRIAYIYTWKISSFILSCALSVIFSSLYLSIDIFCCNDNNINLLYIFLRGNTILLFMTVSAGIFSIISLCCFANSNNLGFLLQGFTFFSVLSVLIECSFTSITNI